MLVDCAVPDFMRPGVVFVHFGAVNPMNWRHWTLVVVIVEVGRGMEEIYFVGEVSAVHQKK